MRMKLVFRLIFAVLFVVTLAACQPAAPTAAPTEPVAPAEPVKIAALMPLSGPVAVMGEFALNGIKLAVDEWNAKGGVLGKKVELNVQDSQCSAEPAVSAANKVITQDGVKIIIGEICSSASIPVSEIATSKGVLQISPGSTNTLVTVTEDGKVKPTIFRTNFIDSFQGNVLGKFAIDTLKAKTAGILFDQGNDYSRGLAEVFKAKFEESGGKVAVWESYTADDQDFSAILTKVKEANPDVLFMPDNYSMANLQAAQARQMGIESILMGADGWGVGELDLVATDGSYHTDAFSVEDPREIVQTFVKKYKEKYNVNPDSGSMQGYDTVYILLTAMEKAGTTDDIMKIAKALETTSFDTVGGALTYDQQHNPKKSAVIFRIKDGKREFVESVAP